MGTMEMERKNERGKSLFPEIAELQVAELMVVCV